MAREIVHRSKRLNNPDVKLMVGAKGIIQTAIEKFKRVILLAEDDFTKQQRIRGKVESTWNPDDPNPFRLPVAQAAKIVFELHPGGGRLDWTDHSSLPPKPTPTVVYGPEAAELQKRIANAPWN